jgi:Holliday junction resolvase-like predicted endonuclease
MPRSTQLGLRARRYGRLAERATLWLLWLRGWDLAEENLKVGRWEMDLILTRGDELRLVEVKARRPRAWTAADTALTIAQRLRLQYALRAYLDRVPWPGRISFQRASWAGWCCRFQAPERWDALGPSRTG